MLDPPGDPWGSGRGREGWGRGRGVGGGEGAGDISSTLLYTALPHGASPHGTSHNELRMNCRQSSRERVFSVLLFPVASAA